MTAELNEHNKQEFPPMHTAEHLLNQTMVRMFGCERSRNAHIERKKSKINYELQNCPTQEQIAEIENKINELIAQDLPVTYEFVTQENVPEGIKLDRLPENASDMAIVNEYTDTKRALDEEVERWERLSEELEQIKG